MAQSSWAFRIFRSLCATSTVALLAIPLACGQTASAEASPPPTVEDALHQMSDEAGVIFVGQVTAVHSQSGSGIASGFVEIQFRVDQAIRGSIAGTPYVLREWAGLWSGGGQRYRVGQRLLMFLYTPGASGLSSPVGGLDGAIPIHGASPSVIATGSNVAQYPVADLRWIGAKLLRPVSYRSEPAHFNHLKGSPRPLLQPAVHSEAEGIHSEDISLSVVPPNPQGNAASTGTQQTPLQALVGTLLSWQKARDAVR